MSPLDPSTLESGVSALPVRPAVRGLSWGGGQSVRSGCPVNKVTVRADAQDCGFISVLQAGCQQCPFHSQKRVTLDAASYGHPVQRAQCAHRVHICAHTHTHTHVPPHGTHMHTHMHTTHMHTGVHTYTHTHPPVPCSHALLSCGAALESLLEFCSLPHYPSPSNMPS